MEHLEAVYLVVTRFEDLKTQMIANNMADVFTIPSSFSLQTNGTYIPDANATEIDLFTETTKVSLDIVQKATAYFIQFGKEYHRENVIWSGEKILNSCDGELRDKLVESTRTWDKKYVGGPTYLKLLLGLILSTSEKSLRSLTDKLQVLCITDFPGENASKAVSFIGGQHSSYPIMMLLQPIFYHLFFESSLHLPAKSSKIILTTLTVSLS